MNLFTSFFQCIHLIPYILKKTNYLEWLNNIYNLIKVGSYEEKIIGICYIVVVLNNHCENTQYWIFDILIWLVTAGPFLRDLFDN